MRKRNEIRMYLYSAREAKGLSMREVAIRAGLAFQHYSMIENGEKGPRISFITMCRISEALDISLSELKEAEMKYQARNKANYV